MAKDINLLPKILEAEVKRSEYRRVGTRLSFVLIGSVVLVVIGIFAWSLVIDNSLQRVVEKTDSRFQGIKDNLDKELKIRALNSKVKLIAPLINTTYQNSDIVEHLQDVAAVASSLETSEMMIEGTDIVYSGRAPTSQVLEDYLNTLLDSQKGGRYFNQVFLTSLSRSETLTEYRFSLKMKYLPDTEAKNVLP